MSELGAIVPWKLSRMEWFAQGSACIHEAEATLMFHGLVTFREHMFVLNDFDVISAVTFFCRCCCVVTFGVAGREDSIQSSWASQEFSSCQHGNKMACMSGASLNAGAGHLWRCPWKNMSFRLPKLVSQVTDTTTSMGTQA